MPKQRDLSRELSGVIIDGEMSSYVDPLKSEIPKSPFSSIIQFPELDVILKSVKSVIKNMLPTLQSLNS